MSVNMCRSVYDYECTSNMWIQICKFIVETCVIHIEKAERNKDLGLI